MVKIEWEPIVDINYEVQKWSIQSKEPKMQRCAIVGGWLVRARMGPSAGGLTFVPDPKHEWNSSILS